jgi:hypothetical protein
MIAEHQPSNMPPERVLAAVSSREDGNMSLKNEDEAHHNLKNRVRWLKGEGIDYDTQVVRLLVTYDDKNSYRDIERVTKENVGQSVRADVLVTDEPELALLVPIGDCIGTEFYDEEKGVVALAHLGRHSTEVDAAEATIEYLKEEFGSDPSNIKVWMSPAISQEHHVMDKEYFPGADSPKWQDHIDYDEEDRVLVNIQSYNKQALINAGVPDGNIKICEVNTVDHPEYFSHRGGELGRFAVVVMLRRQPDTI